MVYQPHRRPAAADRADGSVRANDKRRGMPGLTEFARAGLQVDHAIDQREIADDLCFVTAKTTIEDRHHLGRRRRLVVCRKKKALNGPAMQKLAGDGERHHRRPNAVSGDIHAVKSETIAQREDVKNIPRHPGRGQENPVGEKSLMAQLMSRENRLLNARRQLQILFNLSQRFAQPRIARGEVSLEGEDPRPGVQPRPQLALLYRFAEKIIGPGLKPLR